jgi:hypothetical protein
MRWAGRGTGVRLEKPILIQGLEQGHCSGEIRYHMYNVKVTAS